MARLWQEGFEVARSQASMEVKYPVATLGTHTFPAGKFFGHSFLGDSSAAYGGHSFTTPTFDSTISTFIVGCRLRPMSANANPRPVWIGLKSGVSQITLWVRRPTPSDADNHFFALQVGQPLPIGAGGDVIAVSPPIANEEYHYHEIKVYSHPTDGRIEWRIDGILFKVIKDVNTSFDGSGGVNRFTFSSPNTDIDDIYINDSSGTVNNDFEGEIVIEAALPVSDEGPNDWYSSTGSTNHFEDVDDGNVEFSTYLESVNAGNEREAFRVALLSVVERLGCAQVNLVARLASSGSRDIALALGDDERMLDSITSSSWTSRFALFPLDAAGHAWTKEALEAAILSIEAP